MINQLSARLRILRREMNITQERVAQEILVPRVTYTHYELGKRTPDLDTIILLARFFSVSVDYLIGNTNDRSLAAIHDRYPPHDHKGHVQVADNLNK